MMWDHAGECKSDLVSIQQQQLADKDTIIALLVSAVRNSCCCPNCDGSGARRVSEDEWEQCRWCYERQAALDAAERTGE